MHMPQMPNPTRMTYLAKHALDKNAPAILTALGVFGVGATAVLTARATFKAADRLAEVRFQESQHQGGPMAADAEFTKTEKFKIVWPLYIEPLAAGVLSCGAIVMANRISSKRAAVLAAAYALNEGRYEEYKAKVEEKFGIKKADEVRNEIHQDHINEDYREGEVFLTKDDNKVLVREDYTGRIFWSTQEAVNQAVNEINREILDQGYCSLGDFYRLLGWDLVSIADNVGFNQREMLELAWDTGVTPDGTKPIHTFEYVNGPEVHYRESPFRR